MLKPIKFVIGTRGVHFYRKTLNRFLPFLNRYRGRVLLSSTILYVLIVVPVAVQYLFVPRLHQIHQDVRKLEPYVDAVDGRLSVAVDLSSSFLYDKVSLLSNYYRGEFEKESPTVLHLRAMFPYDPTMSNRSFRNLWHLFLFELSLDRPDRALSFLKVWAKDYDAIAEWRTNSSFSLMESAFGGSRRGRINTSAEFQNMSIMLSRTVIEDLDFLGHHYQFERLRQTIWRLSEVFETLDFQIGSAPHWWLRDLISEVYLTDAAFELFEDGEISDADLLIAIALIKSIIRPDKGQSALRAKQIESLQNQSLARLMRTVKLVRNDDFVGCLEAAFVFGETEVIQRWLHYLAVRCASRLAELQLQSAGAISEDLKLYEQTLRKQPFVFSNRDFSTDPLVSDLDVFWNRFDVVGSE